MELSSVSDVDRTAVPGSAGGSAAEPAEAVDPAEAGPACSIDDARRLNPPTHRGATRSEASGSGLAEPLVTSTGDADPVEPPVASASESRLVEPAATAAGGSGVPGPVIAPAGRVTPAADLADRKGDPARLKGAKKLAAPVRLDDRPSRGDLAAPVVLVEYGDFECPYCAQAAPVLQELVDSCGRLVRHVFRHFPLFEVHPYALTAALAAEVAHANDQFWPMHDQLFAYQARLKDIDLRMRAERLGLDPGLVVGAAAQPYGVAVEADYEHGVGVGVRGTPTIFINGQAYRGRTELPALRRAVNLAASSAIVVSRPLPTLTVPDGPPILVVGAANASGPDGAAALDSVPLPVSDSRPDSDARLADGSRSDADRRPDDIPVLDDGSRPGGDSADTGSRRGQRLRLPWSRH